MLVLTLDAVVVCEHENGRIQNHASQSWVTVSGRPILVATDPERRPISGCPNANVVAGQLPCKLTLNVTEGYSDFVAVDGHAVVIDSLDGLTDGSPPGLFHYHARAAGQGFVGSAT